MTHKEQAEKYLETLDEYADLINDPSADGFFRESIMNSLNLLSRVSQVHATLALQEEK